MDRKSFLKMETQQRCRLRYEQGRDNFVSYCVSAALFSFLLQCFLKLFTPQGHRITGTQSIMRQCGVTPPTRKAHPGNINAVPPETCF